MADEETKAPKPRAPRAPRAKKVEAEPELKAVVAEVEEPKEVKKPAARKPAPESRFRPSFPFQSPVPQPTGSH